MTDRHDFRAGRPAPLRSHTPTPNAAGFVPPRCPDTSDEGEKCALSADHKADGPCIGVAEAERIAGPWHLPIDHSEYEMALRAAEPPSTGVVCPACNGGCFDPDDEGRLEFCPECEGIGRVDAPDDIAELAEAFTATALATPSGFGQEMAEAMGAGEEWAARHSDLAGLAAREAAAHPPAFADFAEALHAQPDGLSSMLNPSEAATYTPQPAPTGDGPVVFDWLRERREEFGIGPEAWAMLEQRYKLGVARYGTPLRAHNGRDVMRDAREEAADFVMYAAQHTIETGGVGHLIGGVNLLGAVVGDEREPECGDNDRREVERLRARVAELEAAAPRWQREAPTADNAGEWWACVNGANAYGYIGEVDCSEYGNACGDVDLDNLPSDGLWLRLPTPPDA